jgi:hypothetical protein
MFVRTQSYGKPKLPLVSRLMIIFKLKRKPDHATNEQIAKETTPSRKIVVSGSSE